VSFSLSVEQKVPLGLFAILSMSIVYSILDQIKEGEDEERITDYGLRITDYGLRITKKV